MRAQTPARRLISLRPLRKQRGVAAVEFALVLVPLLVIAFGVVEYGRAIYHYNTLVKSVRSAVRLVSMYKPDGSDYRSNTVVKARCLAVHGNENCSGRPLVPSLAVSHVKICDRNNWSECSGSTQSMYKDVSTGDGLIHLVRVRLSATTIPSLGCLW